MEHVYDRNGGFHGNNQQNVFASPGSVIPGSATLTRHASSLRFDSLTGNSATVNDVRRGFFTSKIERSDQQNMQHTAGNVLVGTSSQSQSLVKFYNKTRKRR